MMLKEYFREKKNICYYKCNQERASRMHDKLKWQMGGKKPIANLQRYFDLKKIDSYRLLLESCLITCPSWPFCSFSPLQHMLACELSNACVGILWSSKPQICMQNRLETVFP